MSAIRDSTGSNRVTRRQLIKRGLTVGAGVITAPWMMCHDDEERGTDTGPDLGTGSQALGTCPTYTIAPGGSDALPAIWDREVVLSPQSGGFGLVAGSAHIICQGGSARPCDVIAWTDVAVSIKLPPIADDCAGPFQLRVTIPQTVPPNLQCSQPIFIRDITEIPVPNIPVVVVFFEHAMIGVDVPAGQIDDNFPLNRLSFLGRTLVAVPQDSPILATGSVADQLDTLITPLLTTVVLAAFPLLGVVPLLLSVLSENPLCYVKANSPYACNPAGELDEMGLTDFFDIEYRNFPHVSAEDLMSSFVVLGPEGTKVTMFNAPDYSDRAGAFEVEVRDKLVAICPRLARVTKPYTLPMIGGTATITKDPPLVVVGLIDTFDERLSSLRFEPLP